jgi:hypothetical protein
MAPQTNVHRTGVPAAEEALRPIFADWFDIRVRMPLALGESSEPEPDVVEVAGHFADYSFSHPTPPSSPWRSRRDPFLTTGRGTRGEAR